MSRQVSTNNRYHAIAHQPGTNCCCHDCRQVSSSDNNRGAQNMTRVLTCYAYDQEMVVKVNPEMVDCTSVQNNGLTHHQDAQRQTASRETYTSSQTVADERSAVVACRNLQHANSEQKSRHGRHCMNSSRCTDSNGHSAKCMVPTSKEYHCNNCHRKRNYEPQNKKSPDSDRAVVKHTKQQRSPRTDDHYSKESANKETHKACKHRPKENTGYSNARSDDMNALQVNVEFEVDSSSSTCAAIQNMDIEGVVAVNATVCQPPRSKDVTGSLHKAVGGHECHKGIERKSKTAKKTNELDVCIESNVRVSYKKNDTDSRHAASHEQKHNGKRSSKNVTKNGQLIPVGKLSSPTTDKSLTLNSELQLSFELAQSSADRLKDMKECCGTIREEMTSFQKHNEDRLKVVRNKVDQMYFKTDKRNFNSDNTHPNRKSRQIFEGYEKTVIFKTKSNCAGKCNDCKPKIQKYASVKSLQEKSYASEPLLRKQSLENEGDILPQSASDYWDGGKTTTGLDIDIRESASNDLDRRESMFEREAGIRDSACSGWNRRESMSEQEDRLKDSASSGWNKRESMSEREAGIRDSASSDWNRRESMSEQEDRLKESASSDWNRRESMSEQNVFNRESASNSWARENPVPDEQDFAPVDRVSDDWATPSLTDADVGLKYSTSNGLVADETPFDKSSSPSLENENLKKEESLDDGEKYIPATSGDEREHLPDKDIETNEFPSDGWDIEEHIPEEGIGVVDPLPDDWESQGYNTDEIDLGTEAPVLDDFNPDKSIQNDKDPALHDHIDINSNQTKPDVETSTSVLDDKNKRVQADENLANEDPVLKTPTGEETQEGAKVSILDTVVDYLKRGIFLSSEDDNLYRRRNLLSRRIGRDVMTNVGGIDSSGMTNEDMDKYRLVTAAAKENRNVDNYERLVPVPSFRSTMDETTTLMSRPQADIPWNHGHTTVYLNDRVSYFEMPSNDGNITESVASSSENVQPVSPRNNMLHEVSAILKQIDLPYLSKVGSNIRNNSDIRMMPSSSWSAEYGTNISSLVNFVPEGEFGINFRREQPIVVSNATTSNGGSPQEVENTSFLHKIYCTLGALKTRFSFNQTSGATNFNETGFTAGDKSVQVPKRNYSDKMIVNFMTTRENFGRSFNYGNEPQSYGNKLENGSIIDTEDNSLFPNDGSYPIENTNVPIEGGKPVVGSSSKLNRSREVNLDSSFNKPSRHCEQNDTVVNSETIGPKTRRSERKKHSLVNISKSVADDDSQSSTSELSISDAESEVNEQQAASTIDAGTKEERVPFQGIRGYPTRFYPITLYCLCVLFLYLFWTTCYFNCVYTSYGLARRSNTWYCRLYRSAKDTGNYMTEVRKVEHGKLFHPFRPW